LSLFWRTSMSLRWVYHTNRTVHIFICNRLSNSMCGPVVTNVPSKLTELLSAQSSVLSRLLKTINITIPSRIVWRTGVLRYFYPLHGLRRLQFRSLSLPPESSPPHWYTPTNTINDYCFHPLLILSPYLPEILCILK